MKEHSVCPAKDAWRLDNKIRKLIQNPEKILKPYIKNNAIVLDFGCGPGFFTIAAAKIIDKGKIIAVDSQQDMLNRIKNRVKGKKLEKKIELIKCSNNNINVKEKVDFVILVYVLHEIKDKIIILKQIKSIMKNDARLLFIEPKAHVSKKDFKEELEIIEKIGFNVIKKQRAFLSRGVLLGNR